MFQIWPRWGPDVSDMAQMRPRCGPYVAQIFIQRASCIAQELNPGQLLTIVLLITHGKFVTLKSHNYSIVTGKLANRSKKVSFWCHDNSLPVTVNVHLPFPLLTRLDAHRLPGHLSLRPLLYKITGCCLSLCVSCTRGICALWATKQSVSLHPSYHL